MAFLLVLLCVFLLTYFNTLPQPFFIVMVILEAIALVLATEPLVMRHAPLW